MNENHKHHTPSRRASKRSPAKWNREDAEYKIKLAIGCLKLARDHLKAADAPLACGKVRDALKSAEGALRNVSVKDYRLRHHAEVMAESMKRACDAVGGGSRLAARYASPPGTLREVIENGERVRYDSQGNRKVMA